MTRVNVYAGANFTGTTGTTWTPPFGNNINCTTGNLLVVAVGLLATAGESVTGLTDTAGNTYTKVAHVIGTDSYREEVWYAKNITGHATNQVVATYSGAVAYRGLIAVQYAGCDPTSPLDGTAQGVGTGTAASVTTGTLTTTRANSVHVMIPRWGLFSLGDTITWPSGFSADFSPELNTPISEKFVAAAFTGTYTVTHTTTSHNKIALVAAFAAPTGAQAVTGTTITVGSSLTAPTPVTVDAGSITTATITSGSQRFAPSVVVGAVETLAPSAIYSHGALINGRIWPSAL